MMDRRHLPREPVDGGIVSFAAVSGNGASATLSAATAIIAGGKATVNAAANGTPGTYVVTANASGAVAVGFTLMNTEKASLVLSTTVARIPLLSKEMTS
jgi:hypothetical protein